MKFDSVHSITAIYITHLTHVLQYFDKNKAFMPPHQNNKTLRQFLMALILSSVLYCFSSIYSSCGHYSSVCNERKNIQLIFDRKMKHL